MSRHRWRDDRGETLVELAVSIMIMTIAVVALVGGLATAIVLSDIHRKQARAGTYVRAYAEAIETAVDASPSGYLACAPVTGYSPLYAPDDAKFLADITGIHYWNGSAFVATCTTDGGVQRVSLRVRSADGRATEALDLVIRRPCRSTQDFPLDAACT